MKKLSFKKIGIGLFLIILVAVVAFVVWANDTYTADPQKLAYSLNQAKQNVTITGHTNYWEIAPNTAVDTGFIFYPGAKVDPRAYFYKLTPLSNGQVSKMKVFVTIPTLNLAFFSINQADEIIKAHPEIKTWIIGGHSLGGAMSCEYAKVHTDKIKTLWLFSSYCGSDVSKTDLHVVSMHGSLDGVLTPEKLAENQKNLPTSAQDFVIEGANHAQFGNYGEQAGDKKPSVEDAAVMEKLTEIYMKVLTVSSSMPEESTQVEGTFEGNTYVSEKDGFSIQLNPAEYIVYCPAYPGNPWTNIWISSDTAPGLLKETHERITYQGCGSEGPSFDTPIIGVRKSENVTEDAKTSLTIFANITDLEEGSSVNIAKTKFEGYSSFQIQSTSRFIREKSINPKIYSVDRNVSLILGDKKLFTLSNVSRIRNFSLLK